MVDDTLRTDIKGANNAGIDSILFTKTGVTGEELKKNGNSLEESYKKYDARPTITLKSISELYNGLLLKRLKDANKNQSCCLLL